MATSYPGGLDSFTNPTATDSLNSATVPHATQHANSNDAIEAIEAELGVNPSGGSATVVARLDALDTTVAGKAPASGIAPSAITGTAVVDSDARLTDARTPTAHAASHADGGSDELTLATSQVTGLDTALAARAQSAHVILARHSSSTAVDCLDRDKVQSSVLSFSSGLLRLVCFTALEDFTVSNITMASTGTAATSVTLCRFGLYTVSGTAATLVARTSSDTTIFSATNTVYTRALATAGGWPATYALAKGSRYAVGVTIVGTGTFPTVAGAVGVTGVVGLEPVLGGAVGGQTDISGNVTIGGSSQLIWARLT